MAVAVRSKHSGAFKNEVSMMMRFHEEPQVARLLAFVTGMVNQQVLRQNEYLVAENRILRAHLPHRLRLTGPHELRWQKSANGWNVRPFVKWLP